METYYIYKATYYTLNESAERNNGKMYEKDCKSLDLIYTISGGFGRAYDMMQIAGHSLMEEGWELCLYTRGQSMGWDCYTKLEGDDDKDGQTIDIIYSTAPLALQTI